MFSTFTKKVIARLTVTRKSGLKTIVEIHSDATFTGFYRYFRQQGNRRSTKELIRIAGRNEGAPPLSAYAQQPGLDLIQKRLETYQSQSNPIVATKLRIIQKRAYKKLMSARADELGLVRTRVNIPMQRFAPLRVAGVAR